MAIHGSSRVERSLFCEPRQVHRDSDGQVVGSTRRSEHRDASGNVAGYSRDVRSSFTGNRTEHFDTDGNRTGSSRTVRTLFGGKYVEHRDADGDVVCRSRWETPLFGEGRWVHDSVDDSDDVSCEGSSSSSASSDDKAGAVLMVLVFLLIGVIAYFQRGSKASAAVVPEQYSYGSRSDSGSSSINRSSPAFVSDERSGGALVVIESCTRFPFPFAIRQTTDSGWKRYEIEPGESMRVSGSDAAAFVLSMDCSFSAGRQEQEYYLGEGTTQCPRRYRIVNTASGWTLIEVR